MTAPGPFRAPVRPGRCGGYGPLLRRSVRHWPRHAVAEDVLAAMRRRRTTLSSDDEGKGIEVEARAVRRKRSCHAELRGA
jgi:hypothetical protein